MSVAGLVIGECLADAVCLDIDAAKVNHEPAAIRCAELRYFAMSRNAIPAAAAKCAVGRHAA